MPWVNSSFPQETDVRRSFKANRYHNHERLAEAVATGEHRKVVGGMWDEIGPLQFQYLVENGLTPEMRLLDVGCGCLRGGVHFIDYLKPGRYFGLDLSKDLLRAGYETELKEAGLQKKMPRRNLLCSDGFDATPFGVHFDAALAVSVFTHVSLNDIRLCLSRLAPVMRPGARFYATMFIVPEDQPWSDPFPHDPGGIITHPDKDPYHYWPEDIEYVVSRLPWRHVRRESWNHPRDQIMVVFERE